MPNIEKNNTTRNYHDQVIINNELKLRELQKNYHGFARIFLEESSLLLLPVHVLVMDMI